MSQQRFFYRIWYKAAPASQPIELSAEKNFRLDFKALEAYFLGDLTPHCVDLLRVAMAVYLVDRKVRRNKHKSPAWSRDMKVRVEVLDPSFWNSPEVLDTLRETVEFVSGDFWEFEFTKGTNPYEASAPLLTKAFASEAPLICLYSGGLDSAAGLAESVRESPSRPHIPVTVKHQPKQHKLIGDQFKTLRERAGAKIEPILIKAAMVRSDGSRWSKEEPSQRSRSFLFAAAGAVAADLSGVSNVEVFESGVGAINVPLMAGMVGSKATRGSHPEFLRLMSRLASLVSKRKVTFRLPFIDRTKGEMVRCLNQSGFADMAIATVSCVSYPLGPKPYTHCGVCPSCIFRRQAMLVGGILEPNGAYAFDLFGLPEKVNQIPQDKLNYLKAFFMQIASWTEIDMTDMLPNHVIRYLRHTNVLPPGESPEPVIELLSRYRDEWLEIAAECQEKGYAWAKMMSLEVSKARQGVSHATS